MDWPENLLEEWMKFEREFGNIDSLNTAYQVIRRMELQVQQRRYQEQQTLVEPQKTVKVEQKGNATPKEGGKGKPSLKRTAEEDDAGTEKRMRSDRDQSTKQYHPTDPDKIPLTIFVSNLTENTTETNLCDFLMKCGTIKDVRLVQDKRPGKEKFYAYVEFDSEESIVKALAMDRKPSKWSPSELPRPVFISRFKANREFDASTAEEREKRTLFVSNLPPDIDSDTLKEVFGPVMISITIFRFIASPLFTV